MAATMNYIDNNCEGEMSLLERKKSQRSCTDFHHLFMFGMFFTFWIGIVIHAYTVGYGPFDLIDEKGFKKAMSEISGQLIRCRSVCALFIWLAILFLGLYFIAIRFLTKYIIYSTIFLELVLIIVLFVLSIVQQAILNPFVITILVACFTVFGLSLYTFIKVGYKTVSNIIQESCKAMFHHPSSILIVFIYSVLMELVAIFTFLVIFRLLTIPKMHKDFKLQRDIDPPAYIFFLLFVFISCSLWILRLIYNIQRTTLYGIFSSWYKTEDKTMIPHTISLRVMYNTLRYHFGTLTFGSTIFTIIQIIRTIYNSWIDLYGKFKAKKITIFCFLVVLENATSNTFVSCVNYGTGYYRSMQNSFKLLMQNPMKYAATRLVTESMILFGVVLIPGMTLYFASQYIIPNSDYYNIPQIPMLIIANFSIFIVTVLLETFYSATTAILYCFLEDLSSRKIENDYNEDASVAIF